MDMIRAPRDISEENSGSPSLGDGVPESRPAAKTPGGQSAASKQWFKRSNKLVSGAAIALCLVALVAAGYFYYENLKLKKEASGPAASGQEQQVADIIAKVSRLIVLPSGEEPTVATVSDPEKLKDQPFFANAKVGDKVLIFTKAKKAILYDPQADKIVDVSPLNIGLNEGGQ